MLLALWWLVILCTSSVLSAPYWVARRVVDCTPGEHDGGTLDFRVWPLDGRACVGFYQTGLRRYLKVSDPGGIQIFADVSCRTLLVQRDFSTCEPAVFGVPTRFVLEQVSGYILRVEEHMNSSCISSPVNNSYNVALNLCSTTNSSVMLSYSGMQNNLSTYDLDLVTYSSCSREATISQSRIFSNLRLATASSYFTCVQIGAVGVLMNFQQYPTVAPFAMGTGLDRDVYIIAAAVGGIGLGTVAALFLGPNSTVGLWLLMCFVCVAVIMGGVSSQFRFNYISLIAIACGGVFVGYALVAIVKNYMSSIRVFDLDQNDVKTVSKFWVTARNTAIVSWRWDISNASVALEQSRTLQRCFDRARQLKLKFVIADVITLNQDSVDASKVWWFTQRYSDLPVIVGIENDEESREYRTRFWTNVEMLRFARNRQVFCLASAYPVPRSELEDNTSKICSSDAVRATKDLDRLRVFLTSIPFGPSLFKQSFRAIRTAQDHNKELPLGMIQSMIHSVQPAETLMNLRVRNLLGLDYPTSWFLLIPKFSLWFLTTFLPPLPVLVSPCRSTEFVPNYLLIFCCCVYIAALVPFAIFVNQAAAVIYTLLVAVFFFPCLGRFAGVFMLDLYLANNLFRELWKQQSGAVGIREVALSDNVL